LSSKADQVLKRETVAALQLPLVTAYRRSIRGGFFADAVFVGPVFPTCVPSVRCALPAKRDWEPPMAIVASNTKAVAVRFRMIVSIYTQHRHSRQVVVELRYGKYGDYLKMQKPTPQQWKDYQKMQGNRDKD